MHNKEIRILAYQSGKWEQAEACVIAEQVVTLTVNNEPWLTFMCTPIDLEALAVGFLYNEEIIERLDDIASVRVCATGDTIDVWLNHSVQKPDRWVRTSGCSGGRTSISRTTHKFTGIKSINGMLLPAERVGFLIDLMGKAQELYRQTGGVHTSAISDGVAIVFVAEDIGRHNTLDKLAGRCLLDNIHLEKSVILTTGRVSSEMIQKAGRMGAAIVISRTSPSTLSIQMAEEMGITLIGYARRDRFTVYAHPERILALPVSEEVTVRRHDQ